MSPVAHIPLSGGKAFAIVDAHVEPFISLWDWSVTSCGYARRSITIGGKDALIWMHRAITSAPQGIEVDHINHNPLDNRISNLRLATRAQNSQNRRSNVVRKNDVRYKGVYKNANCSTYTARITVSTDGQKRHIYLGSFKDQESAAAAYDVAAKLHFGEFAKINFP